MLTRLLQTSVPGTTHNKNPMTLRKQICDTNKDLWKAAAEKPEDESKSNLASGKSGTKGDKVVDTAELLLRQITHRREEHGENSWTYKEKDYGDVAIDDDIQRSRRCWSQI